MCVFSLCSELTLWHVHTGTHEVFFVFVWPENVKDAQLHLTQNRCLVILFDTCKLNAVSLLTLNWRQILGKMFWLVNMTLVLQQAGRQKVWVQNLKEARALSEDDFIKSSITWESLNCDAKWLRWSLKMKTESRKWTWQISMTIHHQSPRVVIDIKC